MVLLYGSDVSSPANKVRFVLHELGLDYEYRKVNLGEGEQRRPEFLALNPSGKIPVMNDDGFVLCESNAIIKYLARKTDSALYPAGLREQALVDQWMDFASIHVGGAGSKVFFNRLLAPLRGLPVDERSLEDGLKFLNRFLPVVENRLARHPWLTGDAMTLADFSLLAALDPADVAQVDLSPYDHMKKWRARMRGRPSYTRCFRAYGDVFKKMSAK